MAFHDDADALGVDALLDERGNLLGQTLLDLKATRKAVNQSSHLADPKNLLARNVSDVATTVKRKHVVLAKAVDLNVANNDHVVAFLVENCVSNHILGVDIVAAKQEFVGFQPFGSFGKPFAIRSSPTLPSATPNQFLCVQTR